MRTAIPTDGFFCLRPLTIRVTARGMPQGLRLRQTQQLVRHCAVSGCFQGPGSLPAGLRPAGRRQLCSMEEFILPCLPERCAGSFDAENVLLPGLRQLRQRDGGIDCRDTLRRHLDNKWNASKTAQELHLRRSSGVHLRMCIALCGLQTREKEPAAQGRTVCRPENERGKRHAMRVSFFAPHPDASAFGMPPVRTAHERKKQYNDLDFL